MSVSVPTTNHSGGNQQDGLVARELKAALRQRGFLVVFVIMVIAALGLNTAINAMGLYFKKQRVELRSPLDTIPRMVGPWLQVNKDVPLPAEQEHALATKDYINREYIDTRQMAGFDKAKWDALDEKTRRNAIGELMRRKPQAWIRLHMAYYTGLVDTVAHVPERCYVAGGFDPTNQQVMTLDVFRDDKHKPGLMAKYTEFVDRGRGSGVRQNVAYFFQVNGSYEYDSLSGVRMRLQDIFERYGYYCKIEMMTVLNDNADLAKSTMSDFLQHAMPLIEQRLPDWQAVTGKPAALNNETK